jgi:REP element-mobilizing transposase RayT
VREENHKIGFYTASVLHWKNLFHPDKYKELILESLKFMVKDKRASIYAFVIMPNHIHLVWKIATPWKLEDVQRDFMKYTSQMIKFDLKKHHPKVLEQFYVGARDREYQFWHRNPMNKLIDSREIVEQKIDYIHHNPVQGKWMLAESPLGYKYSSVDFYEKEANVFPFLSHYMECFE